MKYPIRHRRGRKRASLAGTALGLMTALAVPSVSADDGIHARVAFERDGETLTIRGFARAPAPVAARYTMQVDSISEAGRSRSRSASHIRLDREEAALGRIAIRSEDAHHLEVELIIESMDGQKVRVREFYPAPATWVGQPGPLGTGVPS